jgi:hypothetical protein
LVREGSWIGVGASQVLSARGLFGGCDVSFLAGDRPQAKGSTNCAFV